MLDRTQYLTNMAFSLWREDWSLPYIAGQVNQPEDVVSQWITGLGLRGETR